MLGLYGLYGIIRKVIMSSVWHNNKISITKRFRYPNIWKTRIGYQTTLWTFCTGKSHRRWPTFLLLSRLYWRQGTIISKKIWATSHSQLSPVQPHRAEWWNYIRWRKLIIFWYCLVYVLHNMPWMVFCVSRFVICSHSHYIRGILVRYNLIT